MSHIFVDLDRTLFDTPRFMHAMWHAIGRAYRINAVHALADVPHWYQLGPEGLGFYRIEDHIPSITGRTAQEVIQTIWPHVAAQDFSYPDTAEALVWQRQGHTVCIVTFGEQWLQELKLSLLPALAKIPRHIILTQKSELIAQHYPNAKGVLVDDRRNSDLPHGITEVWLRRTPRSPSQIYHNTPLSSSGQNDMISIHSLKQVLDIL